MKFKLNNLFETSTFKPTTPPSPQEALEKIGKLPKPSYEGIPTNIPGEDRQAIYNRRVQDYNQQRARIADDAVANSQPPKREDYNNLPGRLAEIEYKDALNGYNQQIAELKQISREAKQANLEQNAEFQKLPPETKEQVGQILVNNQNNIQDVDTIVKLAQTEGFNKLSADEQKRFLNYVGGTNTEISAPARRELDKILNDPKADTKNPETFRKFLREQPGLRSVIAEDAKPGEFDDRRRPYTVTGPTDVKDYDGFASGKADALRYEVEIDGRKIPVYLPKNPDPNETYHTIDEAAKGLAALPAAVRNRVNSVKVEPGRNPNDAHWEKEYGIPNFRSYMTAGADGNINIYPGKQSQEVMDVSMVHETGHILSGQVLGDTDDPLRRFKDALGDLFGKTTWNDWKKAMGKDGVYPSEYAKTAAKSSPGEDFSEALALYVKVKGTPREAEIRAIMPERFALLDKMLASK